MKSMVLIPRSETKFKFIRDLLKKLGITNSIVTAEELEDIGLSKILKAVDKTKKVSKETILLKLK